MVINSWQWGQVYRILQIGSPLIPDSGQTNKYKVSLSYSDYFACRYIYVPDKSLSVLNKLKPKYMYWCKFLKPLTNFLDITST